MTEPDDSFSQTSDAVTQSGVETVGQAGGVSGGQSYMTTARASADLFSSMVDSQRRLSEQSVMQTYGLRGTLATRSAPPAADVEK